MELKSVKTITFARLSNAYHTSFHSSIKSILASNGIYQKAPELCDAYEICLNAELAIVRRSLVSDQTEVMKRYDTLRDAYYRQVWYKLKSAENDVEHVNFSAEQIAVLRTRILSPYSLSVCSDGNLKEISILRSFARDILDYCSDFLAKLQIADALQSMHEANDNYEAAYLARVDEKTEPVVSSELRTATDTAFLRISYVLNAGAASPAKTTDERASVALFARTIDAVNVVIQDIKYRAYRDTSGSAEVGGIENDDVDDNDNDDDDENPQTPSPELPDVVE